MCEPLSVGVHACRRAGNLVGCHVAIMGAGEREFKGHEGEKLGHSYLVIYGVHAENSDMMWSYIRVWHDRVWHDRVCHASRYGDALCWKEGAMEVQSGLKFQQHVSRVGLSHTWQQ